MLYGYARVSSVGQDLAIQTQALTAAGCDIVRSEKVSGTSTKGREELKLLPARLRSRRSSAVGDPGHPSNDVPNF